MDRRVYEEHMKAMSAEDWAKRIAEYRERHPEATGTDKAIKALIEMAMLAGRL